MIPIRRPGTAAALIVAAALATGCAEPLPEASEPEQARQALNTALDAWKAGGTPDALTAQEPPIRMIDRDWQEGHTLVDYKLTGEGHQLGLNIQCPVELNLEDAGGKSVRRQITYVVSPGEPPVITRLEADF